MATVFRLRVPAASPPHELRALLGASLLLVVNLVIIAPLFSVEYSAHNGSIEATFIAIARIMAQHPGQWSWWPFWGGGMPFENSYLPLLHWLVAAFHLATGLSPAWSFHILTAGLYALGAPAVFWMAFTVSRRLGASFIAGLAYSCVSPSALLLPAVRLDAGSSLNLRRLQNLVHYGEAPHTLALVLLPMAVWCLSCALTKTEFRWKLLAGILAALILLSNAFGIVALASAWLGWLLVFRSRPWWKGPLIVLVTAILSYCWVAPWLSPSMIRATLANAAVSGGDFRYSAASWLALSAFAGGYVLLWFGMRRTGISAPLRFFALLAYVPAGFLLGWYAWKIAIIPQPTRYELQLDLALTLAAVFAGAAVADRLPARLRNVLVALVCAGLVFQAAHSVKYARNLIRSIEPGRLSEYKIARWLDEHRPGERAFISGSASLLYNIFTDNPQLHGAHEQHMANSFIRIVAFTIYSGMNAGDRDAEYSIFWLKAFGGRAISVSGANSTEYYKPFVNPHKFEGVLPVLWREGGDVIYEVPGRSRSLAHVIPASAVPWRTPIHGLDTGPVEAYVAALDDPRYPLATFRWTSLSEAEITTSLQPGQVISVQVTYAPGWEAYAHGRRQPLRGDAIGQIIIEPDCSGPCRLSLRYTGGTERLITRALSLAAMLAVAVFAWLGRRRRSCCRGAVSREGP